MKNKIFLITLIGSIIVIVSSFVYGLVFIGDFNQGIFQNTFYNGSSLKLILGNISGFYISPIFNAGSIANWTRITWNSTELGELPNNQQSSLMNGNNLLYHFNELSGTVRDYSGRNNTGYFLNSTYLPILNPNGKLNGSYNFDGIDDSLFGNVSYGDSYTVSAWVKPFDLSVIETFGRTIIASSPTGTSGYGFWFLINGNKFRISSYSATSASYTLSNYSNISVNNWYHLVVSASRNGEAKIYVNGVLDKNFTAGNQTASNYFTIGDLRPTRKIAFNGSIDEVSIWNRTLSAQEVKNIYLRGIERLNLSIKACQDINCSNSTWTLISGASPQNITFSNNSYFQYKFNFETENAVYSPEVYNLSVSYSLNNFTSQNLTENNSNSNLISIEGGPSGEYNDKENNQVTYSLTKQDITKQLTLIIITILSFIGLILLLIYLIIKVIK